MKEIIENKMRELEKRIRIYEEDEAMYLDELKKALAQWHVLEEVLNKAKEDNQ